MKVRRHQQNHSIPSTRENPVQEELSIREEVKGLGHATIAINERGAYPLELHALNS